MRIRRLLSLTLILCALAVSARSGHAQRSTRVGIVLTVLVNTSEAEAQEISDGLATAIREQLSVDVISGVETQRRLPEGGLPDECVAEAVCRSDLGRRLDADELLMLVVLKLGDEIQIDSTWAHVASGDTASRPKIVIGPNIDSTKAFAEAVPTLLPHIKKPEKADTKPQIILVPQDETKSPGKEVPLGSWIAGGVGVAALAGGTVLALSARQKYQALDDEGCRVMACDPARVDSLENRALAADILFGVSAAAATTALVLYLTSSSPQAEMAPTPAARLQIGPESVGFALGGDF